MLYGLHRTPTPSHRISLTDRLTISFHCIKNMSRKMSLAHFLMGGEPMSEEVPMSPRLERGINLHKMIKLFTNAFAGNGGYLTFMGKTLLLIRFTKSFLVCPYNSSLRYVRIFRPQNHMLHSLVFYLEYMQTTFVKCLWEPFYWYQIKILTKALTSRQREWLSWIWQNFFHKWHSGLWV